MSHDVFICYDEKDRKFSDAIYDIFAKNNISSWVKSRDFVSDDSVDKISRAIFESKCFVLILSKNSQDSNSVITETDLAFSRDVPILVFNIDNLKLKGKMEFILETQNEILLFPDTKKQLEALVRQTLKVIGKPIDNVKLDSNSVGVFEKSNPYRRKNYLKKYIKIAVPIVAVLILIYLFVILPTGQKTTDDGIFMMNVTDVEVNGYTYTVLGESYNLPADSDRYFMNIQFFDKNSNQVYEVNSTADEFNSGVIWSGDLKDDNVTYIKFKLSDANSNVLCKQKYTVKEN